MRAPALASCLIAVTTTAAHTYAQSTASFPDTAPAPAAAASGSAPDRQSQTQAPTAAATPAWVPADQPAAAPMASLPTLAARPWSAPAPGYGYGAGFGYGSSITPRPADRDRVPPGYVEEERPRTATLVLGGVAIGLPWATGVGIAGASGFPNGSGWVALPVLGPWAALGARSNPCDGVEKAKSFNSSVSQCVAEPLTRAMLVVDGVLQATGVVLIIVGSGSDTVLVKKSDGDALSVAAAPSTLGGRGYGASMIGTF